MLIRGDNNVIQPFGNQEPIANERVDKRDSRPGSAKPIESDQVCSRSVDEVSGESCSLEKAAFQTKTQIRQRIESGFYQSEHVIRRIAEKLLDLFGL